jgi:hypothetical protein
LKESGATRTLGIRARVVQGLSRFLRPELVLTLSEEAEAFLGTISFERRAQNLALVERESGELARALELTETALALCVAHGDRHPEAALNNLADLYHAAKREADSMTHLKRAVTIFATIEGDGATRLTEIWKLVSW